MDKKKIMLVEDEAVTALDLESNLIKLGYEVSPIVTSGEDAVRKAAELHPDLILMDITLAGPMSGIEAADEIRKSNAIPIVFLTAHADAKTINRAKITEPFGYLPKPCSLATIMSTIEVALYKGEVDAQRRRAEKALKEAEEKYRTVANFTHDWEYWIGPDERIIYTSPSCERITGHSAAAFEKDPSLIRQIIHPDDIAVYDQHRQGVKVKKEDGEPEFRIIRADGSIRWIAHVCRPVYDDQGQFIGTRVSNRDVTRRRKLEEELNKARNLESLGILAGGIAHDFNNLLQGLLGNIDMAKIYTAESSKAYPFLKNAESAYRVAINLTKQFIAFSTGNVSVKDTINPTAVIIDAVSFALSGSNIKAVYDLPENLLNVDVDISQLRQTIGNITLNAREAMPSGGRLLVSAATEMLGVQEVPGLASGKYIKISIRDQGSGIAPDTLPKIFDPYFSTKQRGTQKGLGLGLTVSDAVIRRYNGAITVETEIGEGSTFHIYLPAVVSAVAEVASKAVADKDISKVLPRVLIMDNDPNVVRVAVDFLKFIGYRGDSVADGEEAIKAYETAQEAGDPYAAVILDLTIPGGMGGKEAIVRLRELDPKVKAIVSSGYANDLVITDFARYGFVEGLVKPYRLETLKETLEKVLRNTRGT